MMTYCTDIDLLHWEPNLLRDASFASQVLLSGTADLDGTALTISASSFTLEEAKVRPDHIIHLGEPFNGTYPVVRVDGPALLELSVMYDGLFPTEGEAESAPVGSATNIAFSVRTFYPQRAIVSEMLLHAAGLDPSQHDAVLNPSALRRACSLGTLQMIYSALASVAEDPTDFQVRADLYERLFRRAFRSTKVEIDRDGDGVPESRRALNVLELRRG